MNKIADLQTRPTKEAARYSIIDRMREVNRKGHDPHGRNWNLLTLPASEFGFEYSLLRSDLGPCINNIIGLEARPEEVLQGRRTIRSISREFNKTRFRLFQTTDYQFWQPDSLGGSDSTYTRGSSRINAGLDLVWLDWMQCWSKGTRHSLGAMALNIGLFQRAWAKARPGLLYITLGVGQERKLDLEPLAQSLWDLNIPADLNKIGVTFEQ